MYILYIRHPSTLIKTDLPHIPLVNTHAPSTNLLFSRASPAGACTHHPFPYCELIWLASFSIHVVLLPFVQAQQGEVLGSSGGAEPEGGGAAEGPQVRHPKMLTLDIISLSCTAKMRGGQ